MKRKTSSASGFLNTMLPPTRKLQFKDQMKLNFTLYLKLGFLLLMFAIPLIACFIGDRFVVIYYSNPEIKDMGGAITYNFLFDIGKIISLVIFGLGLSGVLRIYRRCVWNEPVLFKLDFKEGIKYNFKHIVFVALFTGFFFLINNLILNFGSYMSSGAPIFIITFYLLLSLFAFILLPILIMIIGLNVYYTNNLKNDIKNGFILSIKTYIPYILFVLLTIAPFFISYISNIIIMGVVFIVYFVLILPISLLITNLYLLSVFDKYINVNFKEYQYKGLYKETTYEKK